MESKPAKRKREERNTKKLDVGDLVWMQSYGGSEKWIPGTVVSKSGPLKVIQSVQVVRKTGDILISIRREGEKGMTLVTRDDFMQV